MLPQITTEQMRSFLTNTPGVGHWNTLARISVLMLPQITTKESSAGTWAEPRDNDEFADILIEEIMTSSISISNVAELCGIRDSGIRRANREGRINWTRQLLLDRKGGTFMDLYSPRNCNVVDDQKQTDMYSVHVRTRDDPESASDNTLEISLYYSEPILL